MKVMSKVKDFKSSPLQGQGRKVKHDATMSKALSQRIHPREDAGGLSREYVLRIPSVS